MGKTIFRIGMILLVAGLVVGALFLYAGSSASSTGFAPGGERPQQAEGSGPPAGHGGEEGGSSSLLSLLEPVVKITVITAVVLGIQALIRLIQNKKRPPVDPAPETL